MKSMKEFYFYTEGLTVGYHGVPLIKNIEVRLKKGEILTLIGPNGAGKTTILKSIIRQLAPIGGVAWLDGEEIGKLSGNAFSKKVSVVLTDRVKLELMTCEDVVATGRYPYTGRFGLLSKEDWELVHEAMELVHVGELRERDFTKISDGQKQRVMLARAICQEPDIIVLDEPTSFLDIRYKLEFLSILQRMSRSRNLSVIMSLHELELAQKISDWVVCVRGDVIARQGPPEEIFTPEYIADLYGAARGSYNALYGSLELEAPSGPPEVFVIGGGGAGIPVYRRLQRQGTPFAAGVLAENDLDCPVAQALAAEIVTEKPFRPIGDGAFRRAAAVMERCARVLCPVAEFGAMNEGNRLLRELARDRGTLAD